MMPWDEPQSWLRRCSGVYVKRRTHEQTLAGERHYKSLGNPSAAVFVFFAAAARTRLVSADFW